MQRFNRAATKSLPPRGEGVGDGGASANLAASGKAAPSTTWMGQRSTPTPNPSPQGGGEQSVLRAILVATASLALAACGFTPMYASGGNVAPRLSSIDVVAPQGRVGYLLREDLDDALAHDKTTASAYRLDLEVNQSRDPHGLRRDDVAERYELGVSVKYTLTEIATGKIVHAGQVTTEVSYDAADQPYAGIAARQDSQQRAASDAARKIQLQLAAWLAKGAS